MLRDYISTNRRMTLKTKSLKRGTEHNFQRVQASSKHQVNHSLLVSCVCWSCQSAKHHGDQKSKQPASSTGRGIRSGASPWWALTNPKPHDHVGRDFISSWEDGMQAIRKSLECFGFPVHLIWVPPKETMKKLSVNSNSKQDNVRWYQK